MTKVCKLVLFHVYGRQAICSYFCLNIHLCLLKTHLFFGTTLIHNFGFTNVASLIQNIFFAKQSRQLQTSDNNTIRKYLFLAKNYCHNSLLYIWHWLQRKLFQLALFDVFCIKENESTALKYLFISRVMTKCLEQIFIRMAIKYSLFMQSNFKWKSNYQAHSPF